MEDSVKSFAEVKGGRLSRGLGT